MSAVSTPTASDTVDLGGSNVLKTLDDAVRDHIERALVLASGRIEGRGGAADLLGLNPHTLRGKMRKLRVEWSRFRRTA